MDGSADRPLDTVGPRLRELRRRRGTTLTAVAEATRISPSTLSRLESGKRRPTLEMLLSLAQAFDVALDDLVGAPPTGDPRVHLRPQAVEGMTVVPLTRRRPGGGIQVFKMLISPAPRARAPRTHEGFEWLYVIEGRLRLVLGDRDFVLAPGEAAEFDTRTPHWFGTADGRAVEVLSMFGGQGERAHLRTSHDNGRPRDTERHRPRPQGRPES
ncbi:helix-turn-helix domain-containing protein [Kitasatospora griseola]|uniref:helix-turn-helix domain-containing protein n=1 Tax=Kitasatospora griseola TaxID=2064 RepID=UPI00166F99CA|nr:XRE family transcriptional regulator [Kitasatospora griseola]GGQ89375.1 DNA-binding protein [Kitasatospora griseola]